VTTANAVQPADVEVRANIMVVTVNRPQARNAVNAAVSTAVGDALEQALYEALLKTADAAEGLLAFAEMRSPIWRAR
jgi:hypothetical protein